MGNQFMYNVECMEARGRVCFFICDEMEIPNKKKGLRYAVRGGTIRLNRQINRAGPTTPKADRTPAGLQVQFLFLYGPKIRV